jgi:formylglycine-generating enzyme required for sulfatase activity
MNFEPERTLLHYAERFYRKLGYNPLREMFHGSARTIIVTKHLPGLRQQPVTWRLRTRRLHIPVDDAPPPQIAATDCELVEARVRGRRLACQMIVRFDGRGRSPWGPPEASFRQPGFDVSGSQPVVCISWHEAQAYMAWLSRRTGKPYRLPTEAEWEYAARAGTSTVYSFGDDDTALCGYARFADLGSDFDWRGSCRSDTVARGPIPVGSLKPNPWGIFDMHGNAWEWVEDCWTANASDMPTDGSAFSRPGGCELGVMRGGGWAAPSTKLRSATRWPTRATSHFHHLGFRVALSLGD